MRMVVLMSTYNGERFIDSQLSSILNQLPIEGRILIRDDGSTDNTIDHVNKLKDSRIQIIIGKNLGFARSFLELITLAPDDADYFMLSDQDDIWLPGKIETAEKIINKYDSYPILYCSRMKLVDHDLNYIGLSPKWNRPPSFINALSENIVTGCTAAFNKKLRDLVIGCGDSSYIYFHDWWLYLVASAFGLVFFDDNPTILYRQHRNNIIGMGMGFQRYLTILKFLHKKSWLSIMKNQVLIFEMTFKSRLTDHHKKCINELVNKEGDLRRINLIFSRFQKRQSVIGEIFFRLLLLLDHRR